MPPRHRRVASRTTTRRSTKRNNSFYFWAISTIAIIVAVVYVSGQITASSSGISALDFPATASSDSGHWWNPSFAARIPLNTNKESATFVYQFDHAAMTAEGSSRQDGADLRVVAQVDKTADEVAYELVAPNSSGTKIIFDTGRYPQADYFLYFANRDPLPSKVLGTVKLQESKAKPVTAGTKQKPLLSISNSSDWILRKHSGTTLMLDVELGGGLSAAATEAFYVLGNSTQTNPIQGFKGNGPLEIDLTKAKTGSQELFILMRSPEGMYRSNTVRFIVSAPMYVAITIDWEGRNAEQDWVLQDLETLSSTHNIPFTHFFNPRIYLPEAVPSYRANQLTNWVKKRHEVYGDEIAMHLHMFYDMVEAAGVNPIRSPRWGTGTDGYDVLSSGYSYQEYSKLLNWGLKQFAENGLPTPKGFRAGGWFANMDTLRAINDAGFIYDSSGRDNYTFGSQEQRGNWNLSYTAQPYFPSLEDQNKPGTSVSLRLLEIPNNGNDSYWHNAEQLIQRFYANYTPGQILDEPRIITYLAHPDWYSTDKPRLEALINEVNNYLAVNNAGPVVYTTLSDTLPEWSK